MSRHQSQPYLHMAHPQPQYTAHHRQHSASLPSTASAAHRYSSAHANSSAFSASANPNEDWTKISDLAERRRIQNRIAQRNYRKKLKRRLEDLERRANSTSTSPEPQQPQQQHVAQDAPRSSTEMNQPRVMPPMAGLPIERMRSCSSPSGMQRMQPNDENLIFTPQYRHQQTSSPPAFTYTARPAPSDSTMGSPAYQPYTPPTIAADLPLYTHNAAYISPALSAAPSLAVSNGDLPIKNEFVDDDFSQFSLSYAPSFDAGLPSFSDPNLYTPPMSDFSDDSFEPFFENSMMDPNPDFWALYPETPNYISV